MNPRSGPTVFFSLLQQSSIINLTDAFFEAMAQLYDDPQRVATVEAALHTLQQGWRPVEDYMVDFCKWSADTGWNKAALTYSFLASNWASHCPSIGN